MDDKETKNDTIIVAKIIVDDKEQNTIEKPFIKSYLSAYDQQTELIEIKNLFPIETENIHSQVLQQVIAQVDAAYSNFFRRVKQGVKNVGFPRFKSKKIRVSGINLHNNLL
jgi:transposase